MTLRFIRPCFSAGSVGRSGRYCLPSLICLAVCTALPLCTGDSPPWSGCSINCGWRAKCRGGCRGGLLPSVLFCIFSMNYCITALPLCAGAGNLLCPRKVSKRARTFPPGPPAPTSLMGCVPYHRARHMSHLQSAFENPRFPQRLVAEKRNKEKGILIWIFSPL